MKQAVLLAKAFIPGERKSACIFMRQETILKICYRRVIQRVNSKLENEQKEIIRTY